jgi:hypothetical protein
VIIFIFYLSIILRAFKNDKHCETGMNDDVNWATWSHKKIDFLILTRHCFNTNTTKQFKIVYRIKKKIRLLFVRLCRCSPIFFFCKLCCFLISGYTSVACIAARNDRWVVPQHIFICYFQNHIFFFEWRSLYNYYLRCFNDYIQINS